MKSLEFRFKTLKISEIEKAAVSKLLSEARYADANPGLGRSDSGELVLSYDKLGKRSFKTIKNN